ncbi:MAG: hypothetical protein IH611_07340 [Deltaproteobacteria bacterium]|nr:hypothetical protein [Deltaproteobacteria bacterium]
MKRLFALIVSCAVAAFFSAAAAAAQPGETQKPKAPAVKKQQSVKPLKAKPAEAPKTVGNRDKASIGWHYDDSGEPTQERPNPSDTKVIKDPAAGQNPARGQSMPAPR